MIRPLSIQSDPFKGSPSSHFQSATCTLCRHHQELLASGISTLDQPQVYIISALHLVSIISAQETLPLINRCLILNNIYLIGSMLHLEL